MGRQHLINFHGETREGLEKAIAEDSEALVLGEIAIITGTEEENNE